MVFFFFFRVSDWGEEKVTFLFSAIAVMWGLCK